MHKLKCQIRKLIKSNLDYSTSKNATKMCAIQYNSGDKTLEIVQRAIPDVDERTVLVEVAYAGISGTDLRIISGEYPVKPCASLIPGHELSGFVRSKSAGNFKIGDCVAVNPTRGCQTCAYCRSKNEHLCGDIAKNHLGICRDGAWQNYCAIPHEQLHKIPENITMANAIMAHPISCVLHAWRLLKPIAHARRILIIGAGFMGNLFAAFFHFNGYRNVTICEVNVNKLNTNVKMCTYYDVTSPACLERRVKASNNRYLFDVIVDCSGDSHVIEMAVNFLNYGGRFCIFGTTGADAEIDISPYEVFRKELDIFAPKLNPYTFPDAFTVIETMNARYLNYEKLGVKLFKLCDYKQALTCLREGSITKAVFCFTEYQM